MERDKVTLFDLYFKAVATTESPWIFHRWSVIGAVGAWLGRQIYFPFGSTRLFPNQYIMLVGDPGTRKSTAIKTAAKILGLAGYDSFSAQKTSKEKFLLDLEGVEDEAEAASPAKHTGRNGFDILKNLNLSLGSETGSESKSPREIFIAADEFNNFLGPGNLDFQSLLGELWDWDEPERSYRQRLKNSRSIAIYQPTISILAGNTPSQFAECFPLASIGQGFMSRLILLHSDHARSKVTWPGVISQQELDALIQFLQLMKSRCIGQVDMHEEAKSTLDIIYKSWPELEDTRFKHYSTRRFTHLIKLCMVLAAMRLSTTISLEDVIHANTVLSFAETTMPKAIGELGKSKHAEATNKIMQALYTTAQPKTVQDLWKIVQNDVDKISDMGALLVNLQQADKVQVVKVQGGAPGYLPKQKAMNRQQPFTNFSLLKGYEI